MENKVILFNKVSHTYTGEKLKTALNLSDKILRNIGSTKLICTYNFIYYEELLSILVYPKHLLAVHCRRVMFVKVYSVTLIIGYKIV